jgi:hypothetical protein
MRDKPRRLPWRHCSTVWNGCVCARDAHNDDRHVWFNTLDGTMVDPARYPARVAAPSDGLDVARLAVAMSYVERTMQYAMGVKAPDDGPPDEWYDGYARNVAKRYAALATTGQETTDD